MPSSCGRTCCMRRIPAGSEWSDPRTRRDPRKARSGGSFGEPKESLRLPPGPKKRKPKGKQKSGIRRTQRKSKRKARVEKLRGIGHPRFVFRVIAAGCFRGVHSAGYLEDGILEWVQICQHPSNSPCTKPTQFKSGYPQHEKGPCNFPACPPGVAQSSFTGPKRVRFQKILSRSERKLPSHFSTRVPRKRFPHLNAKGKCS